MSKYVQGSRAQCDGYFAAANTDAGLPKRGVTLGGPDRTHPTIPGPGWTVNLCEDVLQVNPGLAVIEFPDDQLFRLGRPGLPAQAAAVFAGGLPPGLRNLVYGRKGLDANGDPIPIAGGAVVASLQASGS